MGQRGKWVDYRAIKAKVTMEMVLARYGLLDRLRTSGDNRVGCCPIHHGSNPRQFSVSLTKNIWHCFGDCQSGGNVLDFVAKMEKVGIRQAALLLQDWYGEMPAAKAAEPPAAPAADEEPAKPVNPPLTFRLKRLQTDHQFFQARGISPETVKYFGLGYCTRGLMKNRIVIPIHNQAGELVAYCGRAVSQEQIESEGKYKLPPKFVKSAVVFNLHRQRPAERTLILVESFLSVFRLHQFGAANTVALMGSKLSDRQAELIIDRLGARGQVLLMFDADDSGRAASQDCLGRLSSRLFVKVADISPYGRKPHQLSPDQLAHLI